MIFELLCSCAWVCGLSACGLCWHVYFEAPQRWDAFRFYPKLFSIALWTSAALVLSFSTSAALTPPSPSVWSVVGSLWTIYAAIVVSDCRGFVAWKNLEGLCLWAPPLACVLVGVALG